MSKFSILLIFLLGCTSLPFSKSEKNRPILNSKIQEICFDKKTPGTPVNSIQSQRLIETQKKFSTRASREAQPNEFIASLNSIIQDSEFKFLLDCTEAWEKRKSHYFKVAYPPNLKNMSVTYLEEKDPQNSTRHVLQLNFWHSASVQQVLPTYMHELLHVCQHDKSMALQKNFENLFNKLNAQEKHSLAWKTWSSATAPKDFQPVKSPRLTEAEEAHYAINRNTMLKEIEAMLLMKKAFEYFVTLDAGYCREAGVPKEHQERLARLYVAGDEALNSGIFAQWVINWYSSYPPDRYNGLFQNQFSDLTYPASDLGASFKIKPLNPIFKKQIEDLGIRVVE